MEAERKQDVVSVSAMNGDGLQEFCNSVREKLKDSMEYTESGTLIKAHVPLRLARLMSVVPYKLSRSGGSNWELPLGRRDSKTASLSGSNNNIPAPNSTIQNLVPFFKRQGLYEVDLVALSGGHTIGVARCVTFKQRLYNQNGNNQPDQTLEKNYFLDLKSACPRSGGDDNISPLDLASPAKFDNSCFKLLLWGKGLLTSDEVLYTGKDGNVRILACKPDKTKRLK
ncbi:hypothetical protein D5086_011540 [Populus alba]|uniref:Uncharacterized protein n=1 Tax=Populus alba TaxID=43335 RepID=A0ACC4CDL7_POPAL